MIIQNTSLFSLLGKYLIWIITLYAGFSCIFSRWSLKDIIVISISHRFLKVLFKLFLPDTSWSRWTLLLCVRINIWPILIRIRWSSLIPMNILNFHSFLIFLVCRQMCQIHFDLLLAFIPHHESRITVHPLVHVLHLIRKLINPVRTVSIHTSSHIVIGFVDVIFNVSRVLIYYITL